MSGKLLVGTTDGLYELGEGLRVLVAGREVTALAGDGDRWWGILDGHELRSSDRAGWTQIASTGELGARCVLPTASGLFVGTSEAHLLILEGDTLQPVHSFDAIEDRGKWYTPWGGPADVRSMSEAYTGELYVNVHVGGVVRSTDGGASWAPTIDIHADVHQVVFDRASGAILAASARGLGVSTDRGKSWRYDADGLHGKYLRAATVANGTALVSASTGPFTNEAAVYRRSMDGVGPFERCLEGLPEWFSDNIDTYCLAASGASVAFGTADGRVFISRDEGQSWQAAAEGLPGIRSVAFVS